MELKPIARRVNMHEGTDMGPHWLLLGPDDFYGSGFTHDAMYSGEQVAALNANLEDLALMIARLVTALRKARPMAPQDLDYQALDLLARKGLKPSPLRETPNDAVNGGL